MRGGGQLLQDGAHRCGQTAPRFELRLVSGQLSARRQISVNEQMRYFLVFAVRGEITNVVAAIMQIVAAFADRAERGIAGSDAGQCDRFFRLERNWRGGIAHKTSSFYLAYIGSLSKRLTLGFTRR